MKSYAEWLAYVRECTDHKLRVVWEDETYRMETTPDDDVLADSIAAMAACGIVAAERGMYL